MAPSGVPFRQFIVKLHGRCDLACDYCYVYTKADQRWRKRPAVMSRKIVEQIAARIGDHAATHGLGTVDVVLHGGEPLLAGAVRIAHCAQAVRAALPPGVTASMRMQTNGVLLTPHVTAVLAEHGYRIGVSLDGAAADHDRHRMRRDGSGSHAAVRRALHTLRDGPDSAVFGGLLCTVNPAYDPMATYQALLEFDPPTVDFLLPHATWSDPPPGHATGGTPYADWLIAVFDRWYDAPELETQVRLFDQVLALLMGGVSTLEGIGPGVPVSVVIETDGTIEQSDLLSIAYQGAGSTGMNVDSHSFDDVLRTPGTAARQSGLRALSATCRRCPVVRVCGGGLQAHRYRAGLGFDNPSVYCADLLRFITHCRDRVASDVARLAAGAR